MWPCLYNTAALNHAAAAELAIGFERAVVAERMPEMHVGYDNTRKAVGTLPAAVISLCVLLWGCSSLSG